MRPVASITVASCFSARPTRNSDDSTIAESLSMCHAIVNLHTCTCVVVGYFSDSDRAHLNCVTTGTDAPVVLGFVPVVCVRFVPQIVDPHYLAFARDR